jgi:hypothetical protein
LKKLLFILFFSFVGFCAFAQSDTGKLTKAHDTPAHTPSQVTVKEIKKRVITDTFRNSIPDTLKKRDSLAKVDSIPPPFSDTDKIPAGDTGKDSAAVATIKKPIDSIYLKLLDNPFLRTKEKPIYLVINERRIQSKDQIFYLLSGLLLFLAFIRLAFSRYFKNIFKLFFQPSFRQKQTREQLQQSNLPSLLLNLFFILSAGIYISFLLQHYHLLNLGFWWLLLYTNASLLVLYLFKFILLSFAGWVFDVKEATEAYVFAVYLINKILGVILIPFTLLIAFSEPPVINISITISILIVFLLFIYRYLVSYPSVRREVKVSVLHFLFYICAFEIMPLLLIYKTLIIFFNKSH